MNTRKCTVLMILLLIGIISRSDEPDRLDTMAGWMIEHAERIKKTQKEMNAVQTDKTALALWLTLAEKGLIKPGISTYETEAGVDFLKTSGIFESVTPTPTNLIIKVGSHRSSSWRVTSPGKSPQIHRELPPDGTLVVLPDQTAQFGMRNLRLILTPVSFKNQHRGFRVTQWHTGSGMRKQWPVIAYLALSETPMSVSEDDVEMSMDNGVWVKPEDSRSLDLEKLGWDAEKMILNADRIMKDAEWMANILNDGVSANLWNILVEKGLIKQNGEPQEENDAVSQPAPEVPVDSLQGAPLVNVIEDVQDEAKNKASPFLLYTLIPPALLAAIYFLRRKKR